MTKYLKYKGVTVNMFGLPVSKIKPKNSFVKKTKREYSRYRCFYHNYRLGAPKDLILIYDMPDSKRKERDWLRRHLKRFEYTLIQKSVWVGPSPLPKDFLAYVKSIGLLNKLRTLKLAKPYSV